MARLVLTAWLVRSKAPEFAGHLGVLGAIKSWDRSGPAVAVARQAGISELAVGSA
jgi:hypothetical protein